MSSSCRSRSAADLHATFAKCCAWNSVASSDSWGGGCWMSSDSSDAQEANDMFRGGGGFLTFCDDLSSRCNIVFKSGGSQVLMSKTYRLASEAVNDPGTRAPALVPAKPGASAAAWGVPARCSGTRPSWTCLVVGSSSLGSSSLGQGGWVRTGECGGKIKYFEAFGFVSV